MNKNATEWAEMDVSNLPAELTKNYIFKSIKLGDYNQKIFFRRRPTTKNIDLKQCVEEIMNDISDRRGFDLFSCDEDVIDEIKQSLEAIIRKSFELECVTEQTSECHLCDTWKGLSHFTFCPDCGFKLK